ncbi:hypothetical protein ACH46N_21115 [Streptomyces pristinaespiralis]|uniref:Predicted protein n=2 Tax=Streptomyces pristinaespiralis TaxID=38300 RepID=D6X7L8_STRE2|nr:hypothetical protein [Streptomyces pristinaespiralis]ALC21376.1 membrane protein [Streptomyces pristinaespiralis]EFH31136.1 predicted protein [Streptomyces pristinaespiralis ATCC 25486]QMU15896.1 hypothetical protein H3L99_21675 [Streptomyces pristinaespiralis]
MSFGDPNNPYSQQPGYGYPQAPPVQPYGGGFPTGPQEMPGGVKAARVMLYIIAGFQLIGTILFALSAVAIGKAKDDPALRDDVQFQDLAEYSSGVLWLLTLLVLAWGVFAIVLAVKFGSGGNGIRIAAMVFGIITAILGIYPFILVGLVHTVLAILVTVFVGKSDGGAWFNRQRV